MIDIHQSTPEDEEELEKWNRFTPNPNRKSITIKLEKHEWFEDLGQVAERTGYGKDNCFKAYLTPKHFIRPINTLNRSKQIEYSD